jgi:hypothetical protein
MGMYRKSAKILNNTHQYTNRVAAKPAQEAQASLRQDLGSRFIFVRRLEQGVNRRGRRDRYIRLLHASNEITHVLSGERKLNFVRARPRRWPTEYW